MNRHLVSLLLSLSLLTGCASHKAWNNQVGSFAALAPNLDKVSTSFSEEEKVDGLLRQSYLVDQYDTEGFTPGGVVPIFIDQDLQERLKTLSILTSYATLVGDLAIGKRAKEMQADTDNLTKGIQTIKVSSTTTYTKDQVGSLLNSLDLVLKPLIENKVYKNLPPILAAADPSIQNLCRFLEEDLDDVQQQTAGDYDLVLAYQHQFIDKNKDHMSPTDKRNEIVKLATIQIDAANADKAVVQTKADLKQFAKAHHDLIIGSKK
jgi:hypothetical protein